METKLNTARISKYFDLPPLRQSVRNTEYEKEDQQYTPTIAMETNKYLFGIEVEVENVRHPTVQNKYKSYWNIVEDGSLRNFGAEFVSVPIRGDQVENALTQLKQSLPIERVFSPRTSVHVHMNVRDLSISQIDSILLLYTAFENVLFQYAGIERKDTVFCVPITDTNYIEMYQNFKEDPQQVIEHWEKYTALNLAPIQQKGTIEFRHMAGTDNILRITNWINFLSCIKSYAKKYTTKNIIQQLYMLNTSSAYSSFFIDVFGVYSGLLCTNINNLKSYMEEALSYIKLATLQRYIQEPTKNIETNLTTHYLDVMDRALRGPRINIRRTGAI